MNIYWRNILIVLLAFGYLIVKAEHLHKGNERLKKIIHRLEGIEGNQDLNLEKEGGNGDAEGMG